MGTVGLCLFCMKLTQNMIKMDCCRFVHLHNLHRWTKNIHTFWLAMTSGFVTHETVRSTGQNHDICYFWQVGSNPFDADCAMLMLKAIDENDSCAIKHLDLAVSTCNSPLLLSVGDHKNTIRFTYIIIVLFDKTVWTIFSQIYLPLQHLYQWINLEHLYFLFLPTEHFCQERVRGAGEQTAGAKGGNRALRGRAASAP